MNADQSATTSLLAVLERPLPSLSIRQSGRRDDPLGRAAERVADRFGTATLEPQPRREVFEVVKAALKAGADGVRRLSPRLLVHVPHALLYGERTGRADGDVVRTYLERLEDSYRRGAARRIWPHYLLAFERDDLATNEFATWLAARSAVLPERLALFSEKYDAFDTARLPGAIAAEVLAGEAFAADLTAVGLRLERLRTAALLVAILGAMGGLLTEGADPPDAVARIDALLLDARKDAFRQVPGVPETLRAEALGTFVEGLVAWRKRVDPLDAEPSATVDLVLAVNGDPRFFGERWNGVVAPAATDAVESWLTRQTVEAFFRVVSALNIDRRDMWLERRAFWLQYMGHVKRAWLIVGTSAVPHAKREEVRYGTFAQGAMADHCGLVLEMDDLMILEMNENGRAIFWRKDEVPAGVFPRIYDDREPYNRSLLNKHVPRTETWRGGCVGLVHNQGWQSKFANRIQERTRRGIRPPGL